MLKSRIERASMLGLKKRANENTSTYEMLPVISKKRSVWKRKAGMNTSHWMRNARATVRVNTGTPKTTAPPWLPAIATKMPISTSMGSAIKEIRSDFFIRFLPFNK